jgi:hypothetical protein
VHISAAVQEQGNCVAFAVCGGPAERGIMIGMDIGTQPEQACQTGFRPAPAEFFMVPSISTPARTSGIPQTNAAPNAAGKKIERKLRDRLDIRASKFLFGW